VLKEVLLKQYAKVPDADRTLQNINLLDDENTFTVTTGHQLNLFTGPLYFLYKIISTINLCKQLKVTYPENEFIPVYWMATEDHDFEEIQFFNFGDRKLVYSRESSGAVGRLSTEGLDKVYEVFDRLLGEGEAANELRRLFKKSYLEHDNLADATRFLAHQLFKDEGLVIIDADEPKLKALAKDHLATELTDQISFNAVSETLENWSDEYKQQVHPREINLFYLTDNYRKRIIKTDEGFIIDETDLQFTESEILEELENYPDRFSPNVIMRPLYQEVILPNLCYIGGGGEIAYWLELKNYFEKSSVTFPILLLRNSALLITKKQSDRLRRLNLKITDLFQKPFQLSHQVTEQVSEIKIDFSEQKEHLKQQFKDLYLLAHKTEKSFETAVAAQERKQIKGLEKLEKRLLKAQKRKLSDHVDRARNLQLDLFPNGSLQERQTNFSVFYETQGRELIEQLKLELHPLDLRFSVLELH
jgi:bacillithiol biosynthesis cysteine-adding enzyme BshC